MLSIGGEGHLTSIITDQANQGGQHQHQDEIEGMDLPGGNRRAKASPEDEEDLKGEKQKGKLNLSSDERVGFQHVVDPPGEKTRGQGKGRGDGSQNEEIEACKLQGWIPKRKDGAG